MKFLNHFICTVLLLISLWNHNALGSSLNIRAKRMSNSYSDKENLFKHEVLLTTQKGFCSGTIIGDRFVLTAAHCVTVDETRELVNIDEQVMVVTVGITMVNNPYEFQTVRLVETIYLPTSFFSYPDGYVQNEIGDFAVLKLNYKLGLGINPRIEALQLPKQAYQNYVNSAGNHIIFTGFGSTKMAYDPYLYDYVAGGYPTHLQYSIAEVLPSNSCPSLGNPQLQICAVLENEGAGSCGGDSGGALFNFEEKTILGVLSSGAKMCDKEHPGIYTRVFPYVSIILNAMDDVPDENIRRESFVGNEFYDEALLRNRYTYHWIYVPDLMKDLSLSVF